MNKKVLSFVNKLEGYKTAIKELHWDSDNMSQHELCDKIADSIAEFQDTVSEVEQSITGKLAIGNLKPVSYKVTSLKKFVEDVLDATNSFYKSLEDEGDTYTGMRSDCESFLSDMQRNLYLVNFTMKEDLKRRLANRINESYRSEENEKKFNIGRHTENLTDGGMAKRISDIIKNSQFNKRPFNSLSDCIERCQRTFSKAGDLHVIGNMNNVVFLQLDAHNGYSYFGQIVISEADNETGTVVCTVSFNPSGIKNSNPDPEMSEPTIEDCNNYEMTYEGRIVRMTGDELHSLIKESVKKVVKESLYGDYSRYAFNNAKNLKDFDRLRHSAEIEGEDEADLALTNHPQSNSNFYSHEYANGNLDLDDLEDDAKLSKEMYGI